MCVGVFLRMHAYRFLREGTRLRTNEPIVGIGKIPFLFVCVRARAFLVCSHLSPRLLFAQTIELVHNSSVCRFRWRRIKSANYDFTIF